MSKIHDIATICDIANLTPDEFVRMVPDLIVWHEVISYAVKDLGATSPRFTWVDDGRPGEIYSVVLLNAATGETVLEVEGPAYVKEPA